MKKADIISEEPRHHIRRTPASYTNPPAPIPEKPASTGRLVKWRCFLERQHHKKRKVPLTFATDLKH